MKLFRLLFWVGVLLFAICLFGCATMSNEELTVEAENCQPADSVRCVDLWKRVDRLAEREHQETMHAVFAQACENAGGITFCKSRGFRRDRKCECISREQLRSILR